MLTQMTNILKKDNVFKNVCKLGGGGSYQSENLAKTGFGFGVEKTRKLLQNLPQIGSIIRYQCLLKKMPDLKSGIFVYSSTSVISPSILPFNVALIRFMRLGVVPSPVTSPLIINTFSSRRPVMLMLREISISMTRFTTVV